MYKVRLCLEIREEGGSRGAQVVLGESLKEWPYEELKKGADMDALAVICRTVPGNIAIITPEEYDEKYANG